MFEKEGFIKEPSLSFIELIVNWMRENLWIDSNNILFPRPNTVKLG